MTHVTHDHIAHFYNEPVLSEQERTSQTKMVMRLFELWSLTATQQAVCLGLSTKTRTNIHKYKTGKALLPLYRDIQERIKILLTIHKYLRTLFPRNEEIVYSWMTLPNRYFENFSPLDIVHQKGLIGLDTIQKYLERALAI
jgi:hypothetical protein